jgi:type II secretory pathway pseudopilin PulG
VTLVELLITITIISILAGLILGVASLAGEKARENQTRHIVQRMHQLLMEHYDSYRERRVQLDPDVELSINDEFPTDQSNSKYQFDNGRKRGLALAQARLLALREMMVMEIPDRWSDVLLNAVGPPNNDDASPNATEKYPIYFNERTDLSNVYLRRYRSLVGRTNTITKNDNTVGDILDNQGAECLYMVITLATGDGEARGLFAENTIGDTDGDGASEFLDGWGNPIEFLRWAPGFDSLVQLNTTALAAMTPDESHAAIAKDHDPFDMFRMDASAFRLMPLIYSLGPDEESSLNVGRYYVTWPKQMLPKVNSSDPYVQPWLTPYELRPINDLDVYLGTDLSEVDSDFEDTSTDNIHNHLLGLRGRP